MAEHDVLMYLKTAPATSRVVFGSIEERKLTPIHTIPSRMGIEQGLRGEPHRGPGAYDPDPVSLFLHQLDAKPCSKKGCYFGATSAQRALKGVKGIKAGPADYQTMDVDKPKDDYKPFGSAIERLPESTKIKSPGWNLNCEILIIANHEFIHMKTPGTYEHGVCIDRGIKFNESFGGKKTLCGVVIMKCTNGIPDKCKECGKEPVGVYFENKNYALCPGCFKMLYGQEHHEDRGFSKVRDCRDVHRHEFPGRSPKIIIKTEKEQRKRALKEAYLRRYYS